MTLGDQDKQAVRERVWAAMRAARVARFPGAVGRIPNFVGAERAAARAATLPAWREARVLKVNPDAPQAPLRRLALEQGKRLYMAVPRLRDPRPFLELAPQALGPALRRAATIRGAFALGRPVALDSMPPIDLVVCGSVAVSREGARIGKGGGYSDLEFALGVAAGLITERTVVLTTVHPIQVLDGPLPMTSHDIPLDYIVTPEEVIACRRRFPRPRGIEWEALSEEKRAAIPVLAALARPR